MRAGSQRNHALIGMLSKLLIRPGGCLLSDGAGKDLVDGESWAADQS